MNDQALAQPGRKTPLKQLTLYPKMNSDTTQSPDRCVQPACSPASFIAEVLRKDEAAVNELKILVPEYTPTAEYAALHARGKEALETLDEMTSLLSSAICICERQGAATNWEGFAASIRKLGLSGVTARTYRQVNDKAQAQPKNQNQSSKT